MMTNDIVKEIESMAFPRDWERFWSIAENYGYWNDDDRLKSIKFGNIRYTKLPYREFKVKDEERNSICLLYSLYGGLEYTKYIYMSLYSMVMKSDLNTFGISTNVFLRDESHDDFVDINYHLQKKLLTHIGAIVHTVDYYNKAKLFTEPSIQKFKYALLLDADTFLVGPKNNIFSYIFSYFQFSSTPKLNFFWLQKNVDVSFKSRWSADMLYHYPEYIKKLPYTDFKYWFGDMLGFTKKEWDWNFEHKKWGLAAVTFVDMDAFGEDYGKWVNNLIDMGCVCDETSLLTYMWRTNQPYSDICSIRFPGFYFPKKLGEWNFDRTKKKKSQFIHPYLGGIDQTNNENWVNYILA